MKEFISFVFYSIMSAIIFLAIYAMFFSPTMFDTVSNKFEQISDKFSNNVAFSKMEDLPCKDSLERYVATNTREYKQMSEDYSLKIKERKLFNSTEDIEDYIDSLYPTEEGKENVMEDLNELNPYEEFYVILLNQKGTIPESPLYPMPIYVDERIIGVCINESFEELGSIDF